MKHLTHLVTVAGALSVLVGNSKADTVYVDQQYGPGGNGTAGAQYDSIQKSIAAAAAGPESKAIEETQ